MFSLITNQELEVCTKMLVELQAALKAKREPRSGCRVEGGYTPAPRSLKSAAAAVLATEGLRQDMWVTRAQEVGASWDASSAGLDRWG